MIIKTKMNKKGFKKIKGIIIQGGGEKHRRPSTQINPNKLKNKQNNIIS